MIVESFVDRSEVDGNVGVVRLQVIDSFRSPDDPDEFDPVNPPPFENVNSGDGRTAGGQHRVQYQAN